LRSLGWRGRCTKQTVTRDGQVRGGRPFTKNSLYQLLTNVTYIGQVRYKSEVHAGEQPAFVELGTWQQVQALLAANGHARAETQRISCASFRRRTYSVKQRGDFSGCDRGATVLIVKGEKRRRQLGSCEHKRSEFGIVGLATADRL
jgi:hypothetical protein